MVRFALAELDLTDVGPERLQAAVYATLGRQIAATPAPVAGRRCPVGRLPPAARLKSGAEETIKQESDDAYAAEYFQSLLELGYLVASADGLAAEEREALARLVEYASGEVVDQEALRRHFSDLDAACETLGRRERLGRVASNFQEASAKEEAMSFAALIAIADGKLAPPEARVLLELGNHFAFSEREVEAVVGQVVASLRRVLEG
jgi:tellurite resistance protein